MGLPLLLTVTLIIVNCFYIQKKTLTFIQNSIVFMVMTIVTTNFLTIVTLNLKWFKETEDPFLFIGIPLYRDVIIPLLVLLFINLFIKSMSTYSRWFYFIVFLALLQGIEYLCTEIKLFEYVNWNFFYSAIVNSAYLLIGLSLAKILMFARLKEPTHDKSI